jgi:predicted TIM-barrel fold metal-dependent hydrolase
MTDDRFLDDPRFDPILSVAESLDVPIYIHPATILRRGSSGYMILRKKPMESTTKR